MINDSMITKYLLVYMKKIKNHRQFFTTVFDNMTVFFVGF